MTKLFDYLPNITLIDETNKATKFHQIIKDKTIIINMFYSNCEIKCVPLGKLMKRVNLLLKKYIQKNNIHFISITLDAKNDTVTDLNSFKTKVDLNDCNNWKFYTGDYNEIEVLRHKLGMYSPEPEIDAIKANHSGSFMIFNTKTGFTKHTQAFDNPIDIARKVIQMIPRHFYSHSYNLNDLNYEALSEEELFENIQTMNSVFSVPFLPDHIKNKYELNAEKQRGFQYKYPINKKKQCCCKNK